MKRLEKKKKTEKTRRLLLKRRELFAKRTGFRKLLSEILLWGEAGERENPLVLSWVTFFFVKTLQSLAGELPLLKAQSCAVVWFGFCFLPAMLSRPFASGLLE